MAKKKLEAKEKKLSKARTGKKRQKPSKAKLSSAKKPKPAPHENDPSRRFYETLYAENPKSAMAKAWLLAHSLPV